MNIAFLTPEYPHAKIKSTGGIGTSIKNLATELNNQGANVFIFVYAQSTQEYFIENGIHFYFIKKKNYKFFKGIAYRKYVQNYINTCIKKHNIKILEVADWTGFTALMNFNTEVVMRLHGTDKYFCYLENRKQKFKNNLFESLAIKKVKNLVAPTKFAALTTSKLFNLNSNNIKVIFNGINLEQFINNEPQNFIPNSILYMGTLIRKKGVLELPYILHEVRKKQPNAKLILIGNDSPDIYTGSHSTWQLIQNATKTSDKEHIVYLGKIPYTEVQKHIKMANVCVFPTFAETMGMVTVEAMAMKKTVVNSNFGWATELLEHNKSGYLVNPKDHQEFATAIVNTLNNKVQALDIGEQARKYVEKNFDIVAITKQNLEYYTFIINSKKNSHYLILLRHLRAIRRRLM